MRTGLKNRMIGDSCLFSLLCREEGRTGGKREREKTHIPEAIDTLYVPVLPEQIHQCSLLWQFNASMQVLDRNFQVMTKAATMTGSCHTAMQGPFFVMEDLATQLPFQPASCLALETCRSIVTLWGEVYKMTMHSGSKSGNFNSYQTLGQNKSPGHKLFHSL